LPLSHPVPPHPSASILEFFNTIDPNRTFGLTYEIEPLTRLLSRRTNETGSSELVDC
jgi:hypothetical protein